MCMNLLFYLASISTLTCASIGVGIIVALLFFRVFFDDLGDFLECLRLSMQPDIISAFRGEWTDAHWSGAKLSLWTSISVVSGYLAYTQLPVWFPKVFH